MAGGSVALHMSRRCYPYAAKAGGSSKANDDLVLTVSVGAGGHIVGPDVLRVQKALNKIPESLGGPVPLLVEDSQAGSKTIGVIKDFQQRHFGFSDGRVDVMGKTHAKISSFQPSKIDRMVNAKKFLDDALSCMMAAQSSLAIAGTELLTGGGIFGQRNLQRADRHFSVLKSDDPASVLVQLAGVYSSMLSVFARPGGLWGWLAFEGEPFTNSNLFAFTWWGGFSLSGKFIGWQRLDTVYLSGFYDHATNDDKIQTIVHELAHFVGPATGKLIDDFAYGRTPESMSNLTPYQRQHNAESFGNFAFDCKFGRAPQGGTT